MYKVYCYRPIIAWITDINRLNHGQLNNIDFQEQVCNIDFQG